MEKIVLSNIKKHKSCLNYCFSYSEGLSRFFTGKPFQIEFAFDIENVPDAVLAIPFVCSVLPIAWVTDAELHISELDESFYSCIPNVKAGYENMFPETPFRGALKIGKVISCKKIDSTETCAMLFSGGADSVDTLYRHLEESPALLSVWGSDIKYDNPKGWAPLQHMLQETSSHFGLQYSVFHSTFRAFDSEAELTRAFGSQLQDNWWHGVKHGLALLGHAAPYAYMYNCKYLYIASTNCAEDGVLRCASNHSIDNHVRFASCSVIHDGFDYSRQEKIRNIVQYATAHNDYFPLHVCWETQTGKNCCHCEKCFRTIIAIIAEGGDPAKFGFPDYEKHLPELENVLKKSHPDTLKRFWPHIQKRILQRKEEGIQLLLKRNLRFLVHADFNRPEFLTTPLSKRVRRASGLRGKLSQFRTYQKLHDLKVSLHKNR